MLRFRIDNQLIDIGEISFTLIKKSPIFYPEEGSHSLTFHLPFTDKNNKILGFPSRITQFGAINKEFDCQLSFDGCTFIADRLKVTSSSSKGFECFLKTDTGNFNSLIKNIKLNEIDYGDDVNLGSTQQDVLDHAESIITQDYPDVNYQFPSIYNPKFYGEEKEFNPDYNEIINYYLPGYYFIKNEINKNPSKDNKQALVPMPYLSFVLHKLFNYFGFTLSGDFLQDDELKTLILYNNRSLDLKEKKYLTRAALTSTQLIEGYDIVLFDDESTDPNEDDDNCYTPTTGKHEIKSKGYINVCCNIKIQDIDTAIVIGRIKKDAEIIDSIGIPNQTLTEHNFTFWVDDGDVGKYIYYWAEDQDLTASFNVLEAEIIITHVSESDLNRLQKTLNIKNHVSKKEVRLFLNPLKLNFGMALFIDSITFQAKFMLLKNIINSSDYVEFSDNILEEPEVKPIESESYTFGYNWSDKDEFTQENFKSVSNYSLLGEFATYHGLPIPNTMGKIALAKNLNTYFLFSKDESDIPCWQKLTDGYFDVTIGDGSTDKKSNATPCTMEWRPELNIAVPKIKQLGSSQVFGTGENDFDIHLLFYRGMKPQGTIYQYPYASSSRYDSMGNSVGNYELKWNGDNGLYKIFWEDFITWYQSSREITQKKTNVSPGLSPDRLLQEIQDPGGELSNQRYRGYDYKQRNQTCQAYAVKLLNVIIKFTHLPFLHLLTNTNIDHCILNPGMTQQLI